MRLDVGDAAFGQRMVVQIGVLLPIEGVLHLLQDLEELQQAAGGLMGLVEEAHRRRIGGGFHGAGILQHRLRGGTRAHQDAGAAAAARGRGHAAQHHADDRFDGGVAQRLLDARQMPAGDMAGLMGDHADELVRALGADQEPGIDEHVHAAGDEGVDIVDAQQIDMHGIDIEAGRGEDRIGELADRGLDLRIADDGRRLVAGGLSRRRRCGKQRQGSRDQEGDRSSGRAGGPALAHVGL